MNQKVVKWTFAGLIAIIAIFPFLIPYAYFPLSKFYSEILSVLAGIFIFGLAIFSQRTIKIPHIAIAAFLFSVFMLLQPLVVKTYFPGNNYYVALLFFIMGLTACGISTLINDEQEKLDRFLIILAWSLVISGVIEAFIAYLQYTGKAAVFSQYILVSPDNPGDGSNIFGNIGQPNQFTDFISISVVGLCYLFYAGQIKKIAFIIYALIFALAITFTARRGVLLYYIVMLATIIYVWLRNLKKPELALNYRKILFLIGGFFIGLILVQFAFPKLISLITAHPESVTTGLERFSGDAVGQSTYRRFYEWYKAIILFLEHPIFGVGWYQYPREGIYIMLTQKFMYIPENMKLYTHCHNSLFNIMAETGIVGTLLLIVYGLGYSIFLLLRKLNTAQSLFIVLLMIPILTHSFLEYPLWYAYFMVLLFIFLSLAPTKVKLNNNLAIKLLSLIVLLLVLLTSYNANTMNNRLMNLTQAPTDYDDYTINLKTLESMVDSDSIFSMSAMMVLDNYIMPGSQATDSAMPLNLQVKYIDKLANTLPYPGSLIKQVIVHQLIGDSMGANYYANLLVHAYPYYQEQFINQLKSDPRFSEIVKTMQSFKYQDKSDLSKLFK